MAKQCVVCTNCAQPTRVWSNRRSQKARCCSNRVIMVVARRCRARRSSCFALNACTLTCASFTSLLYGAAASVACA